MAFLIRYICRLDNGEVVHDETVIGTVESLVAIEKGIQLFGQHATLRVEFDPPLQPAEEASS